MKYVVLIHSNPQPWGHPTSMYTDEGRAQSKEDATADDAAFDRLLTELHENGELLGGQALGDPATSTTAVWSPTGVTTTDGPYAETKEQLAGFFLLDVATRERADELVKAFAGPGSHAELRPLMGGGGDDA